MSILCLLSLRVFFFFLMFLVWCFQTSRSFLRSALSGVLDGLACSSAGVSGSLPPCSSPPSRSRRLAVGLGQEEADVADLALICVQEDPEEQAAQGHVHLSASSTETPPVWIPRQGWH